MSKHTSTIISVVIAAILLSGSLYYLGDQKAQTTSGNVTSTKVEIKKVSAQAFGALSSTDGGKLAELQGSTPNGPKSDNILDNGRAKAIESTADALSIAQISPIDPLDPIDGWTPTLYEYNYTGELPTLPTTVSVLRRDSTFTIGNTDAGGLLSDLNLGLFDASSFQNLTIQSVQLDEDREYGYSFYISPSDGTVSINQNWQRWPQPDLAPSDTKIPTDTKLIQIAADFIQKVSVDLAPYGEPHVDQQWRTYSQCRGDICDYSPATINVVYPLVIEGKPVYEEYGNPSGLIVSVNLPAQRVDSVWGLSTHQYEASEYTTATTEQIQKAIKQGGRWPQWYSTKNAPAAVQITVGTPTKVFVKIWQWDKSNSTSSELLVPALRFPLENIPASAKGEFDRQSIVIPLAAELLKNTGLPIIEQSNTIEAEPAG